MNPNVLILDEPTNGMDTPSHYSLLKLISELHETKNLAIIIVSHLLSDVANVVDKLILMEKGHFIFGEKDEILAEDHLSKIYSTQINVSRVGSEYFITSK